MKACARTAAHEANDLGRYRAIRAAMPTLADGLSAEDLATQSMPDASPGKWHLAHTSWFFEAMILASEPACRSALPAIVQLLLREPRPPRRTARARTHDPAVAG